MEHLKKPKFRLPGDKFGRFWRPSFSLWLLGSSELVKFEAREIWASKMARPRASPTLPRILHPSYYLRRPRRLLVLFAFFVCTTYLLWDRHNLVLHHEVYFAVPQNSKIVYKMHGCYFSLFFNVSNEECRQTECHVTR